MGSLRKRGARWRAEVRRAGMYQSQEFDSKRAAQAWISQVETDYDAGRRGAVRKTLGEALTRYADEVSPRKKGARWERIRLAKLARDRIADYRLADLAAPVFADWRDRRAKEVSPASVLREMALMQGVMTVARLEWHWIDRNPLEGVKRPSKPAHRTRLPTEPEIAALVAALGFDGGKPIRQTQRVALAFLLALETGMRSSELLALTVEHCHLDRQFVHLPTTKNGDARDVPLTPRAVDLLKLAMPEIGLLFPVSAATRDMMFRRAREACKIEGLTFHDSRHYFCTRMAKRVDVLTLAKITGHRNVSQLLAYYNPTATEIAARIAS